MCKECGHGANFADQLPEPNSVYATTPPYKGDNDALCMMHNFIEFKNEVVEEEHVAHKRRRL